MTIGYKTFKITINDTIYIMYKIVLLLKCGVCGEGGPKFKIYITQLNFQFYKLSISGNRKVSKFQFLALDPQNSHECGRKSNPKLYPSCSRCNIAGSKYKLSKYKSKNKFKKNAYIYTFLYFYNLVSFVNSFFFLYTFPS